MVQFSTTIFFALTAVALNVHGLPLHKRIAQVIADSTAQWEKACDAAGGGEQCNPVSVTAFSTLLAAAGPCDQQNAADSMIDLAKQLNNDATMIQLTQVFVQQPRNTPTSQAVPYCQQAPKNAELNGLFQCQFQSANEQTFVGGLTVGSAGTIPFGLSAPVSPAGSCPANPSGPIADGTQLVAITQNPGLNNIGTSGSSGSATSASASIATASVTQSATSADIHRLFRFYSDCEDETTTDSVASSTAAPTATAAASTTTAAASSSSFQLQNGKDAQALNAKFATLTASSTCNEGDQACISGGFAQCVSGNFVVMGCAAGTTCAALPLVNKAGTSLACTTQSDALARIAATGATGGLTGSN
ncbi:hypothetical protein A0H81_14733 [Grifola frondosa]|uniref:Carbohydrate-binding module family 19 domain-containing protein n=1 Tax=Grifola frondosa TaxID=5627 RepID=A0A1C7LR50_GRIFR|nr:hypothetical protein A0H81_14733 [Grifola frondosa]